MKEERRSPLIVAMDGLEQTEVFRFAHATREAQLRALKFNDGLDHPGVALVSGVCETDKHDFFADAKLNDIPDTMTRRAKKLAAAGAKIITVMGVSGVAGIQAAVKATRAPDGSARSMILVVGVLTSMDDTDSQALYGRSVNEQQELFFRWALQAGADGIICSPKDLPIRDRVDPDHRLMAACPGIRSAEAETHDQKRVDTPAAAMKNGATCIIMGRQILKAANPMAAIHQVYAEIGFTP